MKKSELDGCMLIRRETRERLKAVGLKSETYDDIINRLLESRKSGVQISSAYELLEKDRDGLWTNSNIG
jgi:hypothetical protein